jgi:hypothetical protein
MGSRALTCIISTGDVSYLVDQKSRFSLRIELISSSTKSREQLSRRSVESCKRISDFYTFLRPL